MSNDEYHHEIQKMKRQKEFWGGIVQGYVEGYINEKFRKWNIVLIAERQ